MTPFQPTFASSSPLAQQKTSSHCFRPGPRIVRKLMDDIPQEDVDRDVEMFIQHALHQHFDFKSSPDKERCQDLVLHPQHSFHWASAACRFIQGHCGLGLYPSRRLDQFLQAGNPDSTGSRLSDPLYRTILSQLFTDADTQRDFHIVMDIILALEKPLPIASLSPLPDVDPDSVQAIIESFGSLLIGVLNEEPVCLIHTSFRDFLLDEARSGVCYISQCSRVVVCTDSCSSLRVQCLIIHIGDLDSDGRTLLVRRNENVLCTWVGTKMNKGAHITLA
ncbi:hypothetical protein OG21DRAFT_520788 [Imleria badia]|nr:hypothetical protein OG21DRAFT_520788 [Imleria badia]